MDEAALITGASRGIGRQLARCFAEDGHDCVLVARSEDRLHEIEEQFEATHRVSVKVIARDLTEPSACEELRERLDREGVFVHSLVNNAGFGNYGAFVEHEWAREEALLRLNVEALTHLTHLFAEPMVEAGRGRILNVASTGSFFPAPYLASYNASKAYVLSFTEALAAELADHDVGVSCLCPGATRTAFVEAAGENADEAAAGLPDFLWADAREVARYGYECLQRGQRVAVHGWMNKILITLIRHAPRFLVRGFVTAVQRRGRTA